MVCLGQFLPVVAGIIIFSVPSLKKCPGLDNKLYNHLVFIINWAFSEYKLVKSFEPSLTG